jgi:hypothetical protein
LKTRLRRSSKTRSPSLISPLIYRPNLAARDAGVAGLLGHTKSALHPSGLGSAYVAGDALDLGVVKTVDDDLVIRPQQPKLCVDRAGGAALGAGDDPHAEQDHDPHNDGSKNKPKLLKMS